MRLTPEQVKTLIAYLERWKTPVCTICESDDWAVSDAVFELPERAAGGSYEAFVPAPQVYPVVVLTCKTCGNTLLVSAIAAGLMPRPK